MLVLPSVLQVFALSFCNVNGGRRFKKKKVKKKSSRPSTAKSVRVRVCVCFMSCLCVCLEVESQGIVCAAVSMLVGTQPALSAPKGSGILVEAGTA